LNGNPAVLAHSGGLSYTRAANRLHISQPALTKQIHEVERILRLHLFDRDKKSVTLTEARAAYAEEARLPIMHADRAIRFARAADHGAERVLTCGRSQYTDPDLVAALFAVHLPLYPNLKIRLESGFASELVQWISGGVIEGAQCRRVKLLWPMNPNPIGVSSRSELPSFFLTMLRFAKEFSTVPVECIGTHSSNIDEKSKCSA
jgi:DNA-binding transcriptional LysR family regulator